MNKTSVRISSREEHRQICRRQSGTKNSGHCKCKLCFLSVRVWSDLVTVAGWMTLDVRDRKMKDTKKPSAFGSWRLDLDNLDVIVLLLWKKRGIEKNPIVYLTQRSPPHTSTAHLIPLSVSIKQSSSPHWLIAFNNSQLNFSEKHLA